MQARPISPVGKLWRWSRQNRLAAGLVAALLLALILLAWMLQLLNSSRKEQMAISQHRLSDKSRVEETVRRLVEMKKKELNDIWARPESPVVTVTSEELAVLEERPYPVGFQSTNALRWSMGITAEENPLQRVEQHSALLVELEKSIGGMLGRQLLIDLKVYKLPEDFVTDLRQGQVDFGRIGALRYLYAKRAGGGLLPLVVPVAAKKQGVFFTRTSTPLRSLQDVRGRSIAFGDTNATVSFNAQIKLAIAGIYGSDLRHYDFLDSTLEFEDNVQRLGLDKALAHIGVLNSHAEVIERVRGQQYDVGVANREVLRIHAWRGLVEIPGSEFESSSTLFVASPKFTPDHATNLIRAMTRLEGRWLDNLPEKTTGFKQLEPGIFALEENWFEPILKHFPPKPSPPRLPQAEAANEQNR